jgi:hypothetical protein
VFICGGFSTSKFCNVIWLKGTSTTDRGVVSMRCTIQGIFMLCVVSVFIEMVIGFDIGVHNIDNHTTMMNILHKNSWLEYV